ncbi:hypothetical protein HanIR_Chr08g0382701 [Helianthus annuus]|nr:hypothetical protein HanIR_Chr08g0382701 [Helianthus annuus]
MGEAFKGREGSADPPNFSLSSGKYVKFLDPVTSAPGQISQASPLRPTPFLTCSSITVSKNSSNSLAIASTFSSNPLNRSTHLRAGI